MDKLRKLLICIVALTNLTLASAQERHDLFDFTENNRISIGAGWASNKKIDSTIATINIFGLYVDYCMNTAGNHVSNLGVEKYLGYNTKSWHIGYTFPITSRIAVTPILGKLNWEKGYYDGADWTIVNGNIVNKWICQERFVAFDYGINIRCDVIKTELLGLSVFAAISRYIYGFGLDCAFFLNKVYK